MRVTDKLIEDAKKKKKKKREDWEDEEETFTYFPSRKIQDVNREPGAFGSVMGDGINTKKSVFDEGAIFRVNEE